MIIVGTHLDQVTKRRYPETFLADLQHLLLKNYMSHTEPEKSGLPRVMGHVEVSTKSKFGFSNHISDLVNLLFRVACEEQLPGRATFCVRIFFTKNNRHFVIFQFQNPVFFLNKKAVRTR